MSVTIEGVGTQPKEGLVDSRSALYYIYVCFIHIFSFLSFWVVTKKTQQKKTFEYVFLTGKQEMLS